MEYLFALHVSKNYVGIIILAEFTLFLAVISPIMYVALTFEYTLFTHAQGLFVCNI